MASKNMRKVLEKALAEIKPASKNLKEVDDFAKSVRQTAKKLKISAKIFVGGSFAKETFLKDDHDVDVFVLFSMKHRKDNLSKMLQKMLKPLKPELVHGSRDYFKIKNKFNFEIVPVLDIKKPEQAENVTDFSPEHVKWFNKNGKKFRDDVRLAKKFCKANDVYGAESYINGFSGHVLDILIVNYKGFIPLLKAASKWKTKQVIDFYNVHKGKALFELNTSKTQGSLIVVDPVQPDRNASAALTEEKFRLFINTAKKFLKKPSVNFFTEKKADKDKLKNKGAVILEIKSKKGKEDIIGAKLLKAFNFMKKSFEEFGVKDSGWEWDKKANALFWLIPKSKKLPEIIEWEGPPLMLENRVKEFRKKYKKTYTKKGRVYAKIKRKLTTPASAAKEIIKQKYFKEKVKKCLIY